MFLPGRFSTIAVACCDDLFAFTPSILCCLLALTPRLCCDLFTNAWKMRRQSAYTRHDGHGKVTMVQRAPLHIYSLPPPPLSPVIPFHCDDVETCLDGYAMPPSFQECVALGPVTADSIRLDYNTSGPGSKKVKVSIDTPSLQISHYISINDVFLWVRKARQYLNICRSFMSDGSTKGAK